MVRKIQAKLVLRLRAQPVCRGVRSRSQGMSPRRAFPYRRCARCGEGRRRPAGMMSPARPTARCCCCSRSGGREAARTARLGRVIASWRVGVTLRILHGEYADGCRRTGKPIWLRPVLQAVRRARAEVGRDEQGGARAGRTVEVESTGPARPLRIVDPVTGDSSTAPSVRGRAAVQPVRVRGTHARHGAELVAGPMWRCTSGSAVPRPALVCDNRRPASSRIRARARSC